MESALDGAIVSSVANSQLLTIGAQPQQLANNALQGAVNFQQAMNALLVSVTAKSCELLTTLDVGEAAGMAPIAQVATKAAQTTPPITAPQPVTG